ncbi:MAG: SRPBCC domain-containing protein [Ilumatobacteraceae bacterium]
MEYQNNKLIIARTIDAPVELVWQALTDLELIKKWSPFFTEFKAEVGFENRFMLGPDPEHQYLHICKVLEVAEDRKLIYSWAYGGYSGESRVTFDLSGGANSTDLVFTHEITAPFPSDEPSFAESNFIQGWTHTVNALQQFVSK